MNRSTATSTRAFPHGRLPQASLVLIAVMAGASCEDLRAFRIAQGNMDAGTPDAGDSDAGIGAGEPDAGVDAGEPDAGVDAGDAGPDAGDAGTDAGVDAGLPPGCVAGTQYVYTFGADGALYRFFPPTLAFQAVGNLRCPDRQGRPNSMAVERGGQAWVVYTDGRLFSVDTATATCTATPYVPGQSGFIRFGMGYSANAPGSAQETLFVSSDDGRLASIDTSTFVLKAVGSYSGLPMATLTGRAELSGTGDARLFGNFEGSPFYIAEIDKANAGILSAVAQTGVTIGSSGGANFAFAQWGGDFWLFVGQGGPPTSVYKYDPVSGATTFETATPIEVVGAGVSTCVPTQH